MTDIDIPANKSPSNPCSEDYWGEGPESEPETKNIVNFFK